MPQKNKTSTRLAIGDIHGRPFWKHYLDEDYTAYYILGDFFDSYGLPFTVELQNFTEIVNAARQDGRIKLCLGNHDYHYIANDPYERNSRYQTKKAGCIREAHHAARDLIQVVYETDDHILVSHAGISETFMRIHSFKTPLEINERFRQDISCLAFNGTECYGDDVTQGPLWIRPASLLREPFSGYSQIVGHTPISAIQTHPLADGHTLTFIDTHDEESIYRF
jgi:hypothetical protein